MTGLAIVSTTVGGEKEARTLALALVEARLAACVQILPIASVYRWEGKVEESQERLLLCKIAEPDFLLVETAIRERTSYEVPDIVMTPISAGHAPYLDWIVASTERSKESGAR